MKALPTEDGRERFRDEFRCGSDCPCREYNLDKIEFPPLFFESWRETPLELLLADEPPGRSHQREC